MAGERDVDLWVSRRLRELRTARNLTLAALAKQTGISAPHLSRLEKGERQPSIGGLLQIARVYGVSLSELVEEDHEEGFHLLRAADVVRHDTGNGVFAVLSGPRSAISMIRIELPVGKATQPAQHDGEEWLHALAGTVELRIGDKDVRLSEGDSVHFDSSRPHRLSAVGERPVTVLMASTATTMPLHHPVPAASRGR
ncbi:helix-turn-helix transcriptional regulator [Streptomyces sioyaensis]|uniref:XRE family transcriptional regulator n=1 Tax=Streptomyces sioyaensis TaxID=67364 RepID=A0A4Q1R8S7_9ACTN|nr:XRE family transcriptional regulator [Streptomyces sioyaensis]MBM4790635.1 helix-turn-helix transcriptional regulator [Streptomyces sioyaensis]RXS69804.1 XRE family transcriptional regulator [Streptomyces sioyaensis]